MANFSAQAKVGLVIVVSIIMIIAGLGLLERSVKGQTYNVTIAMPDARGLSKGVDVRLSGVVKGSVTGVERPPDREVAVVSVKLKKDTLIPKDAVFVASTEGMVAEKVINVVIPEDSKMEWAEEGYEFQGYFEDGFDQLLVKGNKMMEKLEQMITAIAETVDESLINETLIELSTKLRDSMDNVNELLLHIDSLVGANADEINATLTNLKDMTSTFKLVSEDIRKVVSDPVLLARLDTITYGLEESVANMQKISSDIEEVTGDPEVKQNLKDSLRLTKETLEEAKGSITEFKGSLSSVSKKVDQLSKLSEVDVSGKVVGRFVRNDDVPPGEDKNKALADVEMQAETKKGFIRVGGEAIGEDTVLSLQGGRRITPDFALRGGIVRSKVGMGMEYKMGEVLWSSDLYDPNDPKFNSYLGLKLSSDYTLRLGVEDIFGDVNPMVGVTFDF